jgi:hypothetical protein
MTSITSSSSTIEGVELTGSKIQQRIVTLDFQRGLAIFLMVFFHSIQHLYDISWATNVDELFKMNILVILSVILMAFFTGWAGYFLIISAIVNALAMSKRASKGHRPIQILVKQLLTGVGILFAAMLTEGLFGYYGYLGNGIRINNWTYAKFLQTFLGRSFFLMETLQTIGWCMIITGVIQFFLIRNNGYKKLKRNVIIFAFLVIIIIALSPIMWNWADNMNWGGYYNFNFFSELTSSNSQYFTSFRWPNEFDQYKIGTFKASLFSLLTGDLEPLFPFLSTSFLGALIGTILAEDKPPKRLPFYGALTSLGFIATGAILIAAGLPFDFTWFRPMMSYFLILMGTWVGVITLLLYLVEYRGSPARFANRRVVRLMRLWGVISLSVFSLQIFSLFPRWLLSFLLKDINLMNYRLPFGQEGYVILICIYILFAYHFLIKAWSKVNFKFSFEWFIIRFANIGSKRDISSRLNVDIILNKTIWYSFKREELYRLSALVLSVLFGFLGMHRFYLGKTKSNLLGIQKLQLSNKIIGLIYLLTGGLVLVGVFYDIYLMIKGKEPYNIEW